jgi:uncharacterized membrane protein
MTMDLEKIYWATGALLLVFAWLTVRDREHPHRWPMAAFWGLYGLVFLFGKRIPAAATGGIVVVLTVIAAARWMGLGNYRSATRAFKLQMSEKLKLWVFAPALMIPLATLAIGAFLPRWGLLVGFGIGAVLSLGFALALMRPGLGQSFEEGRRLADSMGWAVILPQFLAALGFLFDKAGVGSVVARLMATVVPVHSRLAVVAAYCIGMMLFTTIMGNAFAAFAVMTSGIGIPLVLLMHGGNPAIAGVIAMLSGYCGTLLTPMAANFNIVPAALLEMQDQNGVIKAQVLTAIPVLVVNIFLMYFLAFPGR